MMSGMRKPSPISINSPRETITSPPLASVFSTRKIAAALLLTTMAAWATASRASRRSEEHTSELQSRLHLVCRLLLEKKKREEDDNIRRTHVAVGQTPSQ